MQINVSFPSELSTFRDIPNVQGDELAGDPTLLCMGPCSTESVSSLCSRSHRSAQEALGLFCFPLTHLAPRGGRSVPEGAAGQEGSDAVGAGAEAAERGPSRSAGSGTGLERGGERSGAQGPRGGTERGCQRALAQPRRPGRAPRSASPPAPGSP